MRERTSEPRRIEILNAAQLRFARFGLEKVTMDEIAADIGLAKGALYYYYPTKEALFKAVVAKEEEQFRIRMQQVVDVCESAEKKFVHYIDQRLAFIQEVVNLNELNVRSLVAGNPLFRELFRNLATLDQEFLSDILKQGTEEGVFRVESCENTAALVIRVLQGLRFQSLKRVMFEGGEGRENHEALATEMHQVALLLLNGLLNER